METEKLSQYAADRIRTGVGKDEVKAELITVGWTEDEAEAAFRSGVIALGAPVPSEGNRPTTSKQASTVDVVINFFSFILLGIVATALGLKCKGRTSVAKSGCSKRSSSIIARDNNATYITHIAAECRRRNWQASLLSRQFTAV
jgi:hypothetical protein